MKIVMLLDKGFNGDMRVENEVMSLRKAGFDVTVLSFNFDKKYEEDDFYGARIIKLPVKLKVIRKLRALTNTVFNYYPYYIIKLIKPIFDKEKFDVFHIHDLYLFEVGIILKRKYFPNLNLVGDLHENYVEGLKYYKFANSFPGNLLISIKKWEQTEIDWCNKFDRLITVIDEAVNRYSGLGIDEKKITVVANYVEREHFLTDKFDEDIIIKYKDSFTALYIGGFDVHRGLSAIIKGIPEILKTIPNFKFVLVGRGKIENELKELAKKLGVDRNVSFEGFQNPEKLPSYIKASDICLIPHLKTVHTDNTIPHKLFHYMIMGKPVIATNCNPIERILTESEAGLIYENNNHEDFSRKVIELYHQKDLMTKMGEKGKFAVENKFNWSETSKNLIQMYEEIRG